MKLFVSVAVVMRITVVLKILPGATTWGGLPLPYLIVIMRCVPGTQIWLAMHTAGNRVTVGPVIKPAPQASMCYI